MSNRPLYVAQPYLPPLEELIPHLEVIWESRILTNGGPYHQRFEQALADLTGCPSVALCANGTLALVLALQALGITGEVITTPYSFVTTSHSLHWNGIKPVFVDIDPDTLNIASSRIEAANTPQTTAILALHCYGQPADTAAIQKNRRYLQSKGHLRRRSRLRRPGLRRQHPAPQQAEDGQLLKFEVDQQWRTECF